MKLSIEKNDYADHQVNKKYSCKKNAKKGDEIMVLYVNVEFFKRIT